MTKNGYAIVKVKVDLARKTVTCDPDPFKCYWEAGPANVRWTFPDLPREVAAVLIEWQRGNDPKYKNKPMFHAQGVAASLSGSHLGDIVTAGNVRERGKFKYAVTCVDGQGNVLASADPEGDNDDIPKP